MKHDHAQMCEPNAAGIAMANFKSCLKEKALVPGLKPSRAVQDALVETDKDILPLLGSKESMRQLVKRTKRKAYKLPPIPQSFNQFVIDTPLNLTISGESFLFIRKFIEADSFLVVFTTNANLDHLANSYHWIMDGTFKSSPTLFSQIYTIHGFIGNQENGRSFPLVYSLLSSKTELLYRELIKELKNAIGERHMMTQVVITDFEKAAMNAVDKELEIDYAGCYFHLRKSFLKKAKKLGLQKKLGTDLQFQKKFNMLSCLAFLPHDEIPQAFSQLSSIFPVEENVTSFLKYIEKNYVVGNLERNPIRPPKFPPQFWSVFDRTALGLPRTQNVVESWHNRLNVLVGTPHPNPYALVDQFRKEEHSVSGDISCLLLSGGSQTARKKRYLEKEKKIIELLEQRNSMSTLEFLERIDYRMKAANNLIN